MTSDRIQRTIDLLERALTNIRDDLADDNDQDENLRNSEICVEVALSTYCKRMRNHIEHLRRELANGNG